MKTHYLNSMHGDSELSCLGTIILVGLCLIWWPIASAVESKTFNRLTGANTTWWDAMWVTLRVQEGVIQDKEGK